MKIAKNIYKTLLSLAVAGVAFITFSCANLMQGKIEGDLKVYESLSSVAKSGSSSKVLDTPSQVNATQNEFNSKIIVSWNDVDNREYFIVERCIADMTTLSADYVPDESEFSVICEYTNDLSYVDDIFKTTEPSFNATEYNYRYYYRVTAACDGYESSDASSCDVYGTLFAATQEIDATCGKSQDSVTISWDKVEGASYYKVFKAESYNGNYTQIATTRSLSYSESISEKMQGIEFFYKVQAVNGRGNTTVNSAYALGYAKEAGAPDAPAAKDAVSSKAVSKDSITISWPAVDGGDETVYYALYRKSSASSQKECLSSKLAATTYTDTDVSAGIEYYYTIVSFYEKNEEGSIKQVKSEESERIVAYLLSAPKNVFVEKSASGRKVTFTPAVGYAETPYGYKIYSYATQSDAENNVNGECVYTLKFDNASSAVSALNDSGYYEVSVDLNKCNFARITTMKEPDETVESELSSIGAPSPDAPLNTAATKAGNVGGSYSANANGILPVKITWTSASTDTWGFRVYRSTKRDSGYTEITTKPIEANGGTSFSFIDQNASAKVYTPYYYRVLSLNSLGKGTNYSTPDWGYGALTPEQYLIEYNKTIIRSQKKLPIGSTQHTACKGDLNGGCDYDASAAVSGALSGDIPIYMLYTDYADFKTKDGDGNDKYNYFLNGHTDTHITSIGSRSGHMAGTMTASNCWYPGTIKYDNVEIKSSKAGGGYYTVTVQNFSAVQVDWTIGEIGW